MSDQTPPRVRVTSPQTHVRRRRRPVSSEIDAHREVGEFYMASLVGAQLRLALVALAPLVLIGFGLPLLFLYVPALCAIRVGPFSVTWFIAAVSVYPVLVAVGWLYVRAAEKNEREFTAAVEE